MNGLENTIIQCPFCWEEFETVVDCSSLESHGEAQQYTEDCYVCCRPILITINLNEQGAMNLSVEAEYV